MLGIKVEWYPPSGVVKKGWSGFITGKGMCPKGRFCADAQNLPLGLEQIDSRHSPSFGISDSIECPTFGYSVKVGYQMTGA